MTRNHRKKAKQVQQMTKLERLAAQVPPGYPAFLPTEDRVEHGDFHVEQLTSTAVQGDPPGSKPPRRVTMGYAVRDRMASAKSRLRRFPNLSAEQIAAGEKFETEWEESGLEPRLIANLMGTGGGRGPDMSPVIAAAKTKVVEAIRALRTGGAEVQRVVEAVVIKGATSMEAAEPRFTNEERGRVYTATTLSIGLNLLAVHYRTRTSGRRREAANDGR